MKAATWKRRERGPGFDSMIEYGVGVALGNDGG